MPILSRSNSSFNMGTPSFHELKKQASFFLKEKIKTARLALTDVTPTELMTEEATNGNSWAPNTQTLGSISKAAFELEDYWRIVGILHKRFIKFERRNWRASYNSLIVLEHLLTHGPESVAEEFQSDRDVISQMEAFQHIDEKGFNWGLAVRRKSERVLKLLEKGPLLKEERNRARKLSRGIQGFGSFNRKSSSSEKGILQESALYRKCNSAYNEHGDEENRLASSGGGDSIRKETQGSDQEENRRSRASLKQKVEEPESSSEENVAPENEGLQDRKSNGERKPLLGGERDALNTRFTEEDETHPFNDSENQSVVSLL